MHHELATFARACLAHYGELQLETTQAKDRQDYVTNVDHALDRFIGDWISRTYPQDRIVSEEAPESWKLGGDDVWIVDPLDGTHNFMAGLPHFAVSVARQRAGETVAGFVANLATGDINTAAKHEGARLNSDPLSVATPPAELIGVSTGATDSMLGNKALFTLLRQHGKLRNLGSQALHLCYAAEGRFALAVSLEAKIWDDAAGALIAREAGAVYQPLGDPARDGLGVSMGSLCGSADLIAAIAPYFEHQEGDEDDG